MDGRIALQQAITLAGNVLVHATDDDWHKPTPCTEWDFEELTKHVVYELLWAAPLLAGKTIAEVGDAYDGDILQGNPIEAWITAARDARNAADAADPEAKVHLSYGDVAAKDYIMELAADVLVHGWDMARARGVEYDIPDELARAAYDYMKPHIAGYQGAGLVAAAVEVPEDASWQEKLIALTGRTPSTG